MQGIAVHTAAWIASLAAAMALFVHFGVMRDAPGPVCLGRDDRYGGAFIQVGAQPIVVEGLVADECLKIETGDQRLDTECSRDTGRAKERSE